MIEKELYHYKEKDLFSTHGLIDSTSFLIFIQQFSKGYRPRYNTREDSRA
jgi:hypothetical protein